MLVLSSPQAVCRPLANPAIATIAATPRQCHRAGHGTIISESEKTDKPLLPAAIDATAGIHPEQTLETIGHLMDAKDKDVLETVYEALSRVDALGEADDESK